MTKPADQIAKARRERYTQEKPCCTVCDGRKVCTICGDQTRIACSDCRIDFQTTVYVCQKTACQHEHEEKCSARLREKLASERQAVIEECAKMADQIAKSCSACSYSRKKHGEEPSFCENFGCSSFADLATAIRSMERDSRKTILGRDDMTNEALREIGRKIGNAVNPELEAIELLGHLGAAVSASPQPDLLAALEVIAIALKEPAGGEYWSARKFLDERGIFNGDLDGERVLLRVAQAAIASAPAQEPDSDLLARYNRAYTILADALNLNPEFYGLVEMTQIVAKRLTGKYDEPVENSPIVTIKLMRDGSMDMNLPTESLIGLPEVLEEAAAKLRRELAEPSPQKGKP